MECGKEGLNGNAVNLGLVQLEEVGDD